MEIEVKQYWSDNFDQWFYYVVTKGFFRHRIKWERGYYSVRKKNGFSEPVSRVGDRTRYFDTADDAQEYIEKRYVNNGKTVRIIQID